MSEPGSLSFTVKGVFKSDGRRVLGRQAGTVDINLSNVKGYDKVNKTINGEKRPRVEILTTVTQVVRRSPLQEGVHQGVAPNETGFKVDGSIESRKNQET